MSWSQELRFLETNVQILCLRFQEDFRKAVSENWVRHKRTFELRYILNFYFVPGDSRVRVKNHTLEWSTPEKVTQQAHLEEVMLEVKNLIEKQIIQARMANRTPALADHLVSLQGLIARVTQKFPIYSNIPPDPGSVESSMEDYLERTPMMLRIVTFFQNHLDLGGPECYAKWDVLRDEAHSKVARPQSLRALVLIQGKRANAAEKLSSRYFIFPSHKQVVEQEQAKPAKSRSGSSQRTKAKKSPKSSHENSILD